MIIKYSGREILLNNFSFLIPHEKSKCVKVGSIKTGIDGEKKKKITLGFESSHCLRRIILFGIGPKQETDIKTKRCDETNIQQQDHNQIPLAGLDVANIESENP